MVEWLGVAAGTLTMLSFVPQVVKTWRTTSVEDVSLWMLFAFNGGITLWLTYGILTNKPSIIFANSIAAARADAAWTEAQIPKRAQMI